MIFTKTVVDTWNLQPEAEELDTITMFKTHSDKDKICKAQKVMDLMQENQINVDGQKD